MKMNTKLTLIASYKWRDIFMFFSTNESAEAWNKFPTKSNLIALNKTHSRRLTLVTRGKAKAN